MYCNGCARDSGDDQWCSPACEQKGHRWRRCQICALRITAGPWQPEGDPDQMVLPIFGEARVEHPVEPKRTCSRRCSKLLYWHTHDKHKRRKVWLTNEGYLALCELADRLDVSLTRAMEGLIEREGKP